MSEPRPLHRLFGLSWTDFFQGSDVGVEPEMDLSFKQQFVDLVLIRKGPGPIPRPLPDGFEDLATHNLVTFKSHQEALDGWALCELIGHYVNYPQRHAPPVQCQGRVAALRQGPLSAALEGNEHAAIRAFPGVSRGS